MTTYEMVLAMLGLLVYMAPGWIAEVRNKRNFNSIAVLNIFLGWTFIGWVAALVWALMKDEPLEPAQA